MIVQKRERLVWLLLSLSFLELLFGWLYVTHNSRWEHSEVEGEELSLAHDDVEDDEDGEKLYPPELEHVPHLGLENVFLLHTIQYTLFYRENMQSS